LPFVELLPSDVTKLVGTLDSVLPGLGNVVGLLFSFALLPFVDSAGNDVGTTRAVVVVGKVVGGLIVVVDEDDDDFVGVVVERVVLVILD